MTSTRPHAKTWISGVSSEPELVKYLRLKVSQHTKLFKQKYLTCLVQVSLRQGQIQEHNQHLTVVLVPSVITCLSTSSSSPSDLPNHIPFNFQDRLQVVKKGPYQPHDYIFPKRSFSNRNISFNPSWYDIPEARDWLEYSPLLDKIYCFTCHLFDTNVK